MANQTVSHQTIPKQIDYKPVHPVAVPNYRYLRVLANTIQSSNSFQIQAGTSQELTFPMPAGTVYNLARSFVGYQIFPDAQAAYTWVNEDVFELASSAYFGDNAGTDLCNLQFANRYSKVARKMKTSLQDFMTFDKTNGLYPSNNLATANYPLVGTAGTANTTNYTEPTYTGVSGNAAQFTAATIPTRYYPLGGLTDTIFSVDKDLYFGERPMYSRFIVGPGNSIAWAGTSATVPATGAGAIVGNITFNNVYLWLAVETNPLIKESVMEKVKTSGLRLNIPTTQGIRNSTNSTAINIQIQLQKSWGSKFRRMLYTVWPSAEQYNTMFDCSNLNGSKVVSYNTTIDNTQRQDFLVSTLDPTTAAINADDWRINKRYLTGSVMQNRNVYQNNWVHVDQTYESNAQSDDSNYEEGMDMTEPHTWSIAATANGALALSHYNFATFTREIVIDKEGPKLI